MDGQFWRQRCLDPDPVFKKSWIRIWFALRGLIRIRSISDRIRILLDIRDGFRARLSENKINDAYYIKKNIYLVLINNEFTSTFTKYLWIYIYKIYEISNVDMNWPLHDTKPDWALCTVHTYIIVCPFFNSRLWSACMRKWWKT